MKITQKIFEIVIRVSKKYFHWKRTTSLCTLYTKFNEIIIVTISFLKKHRTRVSLSDEKRFRSRTEVGQYDSKLRKLSDIHLTEIDSKYKLIIEL